MPTNSPATVTTNREREPMKYNCLMTVNGRKGGLTAHHKPLARKTPARPMRSTLSRIQLRESASNIFYSVNCCR